jgi:hypothetical protein
VNFQEERVGAGKSHQSHQSHQGNGHVKCDHLNPATWAHREGNAFCVGCDKYMGRVTDGCE